VVAKSVSTDLTNDQLASLPIGVDESWTLTAVTVCEPPEANLKPKMAFPVELATKGELATLFPPPLRELIANVWLRETSTKASREKAISKILFIFKGPDVVKSNYLNST
jgi:hypothetical protein